MNTGLGIMYVTTVLFQLIAWYLDNVLPQEYGTPLKWNFPCQRMYWKKAEIVGSGSTRSVPIGPSYLKMHEVVTAMMGVMKVAAVMEKALGRIRVHTDTATDDVVEPLDPHTAAVVESGRALVIKSLRKHFPSNIPGKRFVAVDGVDMTMAEVIGCITALYRCLWGLICAIDSLNGTLALYYDRTLDSVLVHVCLWT